MVTAKRKLAEAHMRHKTPATNTHRNRSQYPTFSISKRFSELQSSSGRTTKTTNRYFYLINLSNTGKGFIKQKNNVTCANKLYSWPYMSFTLIFLRIFSHIIRSVIVYVLKTFLRE